MERAATYFYGLALSVALSASALAQPHEHAPKQRDHGSSVGNHTDTAPGHTHGAGPGTIAVPRDLDTATTKLSAHEHYRVSISPEKSPVTINTLHNWVLEIMTRDGKPAPIAEVTIDGGMPAHGHGLPTAPRFTDYLGDGKYRVDGVRFNMAGWWQLTFAIKGPHADTASFNIVAE